MREYARKAMHDVTVFGFGNPGRGDDGIGPWIAEALRAHALPGVQVRVAFQLAVEHALDVADSRTVIFVDATTDPADAPWSLSRLRPSRGLDFSTHALEPGRVLALAQELFDASPPAWLLTVTGECFDPFVEELSAPARARAREALATLLGFVRGAVCAAASTARS